MLVEQTPPRRDDDVLEDVKKITSGRISTSSSSDEEDKVPPPPSPTDRRESEVSSWMRSLEVREKDIIRREAQVRVPPVPEPISNMDEVAVRRGPFVSTEGERAASPMCICVVRR